MLLDARETHLEASGELADRGIPVRVNLKESSPDHLFDSDLLRIVNQRSDALTIVFDQALPRGRERSELEMKLEKIHSKGLHGFAYHSHACFLFVSRKPTTKRARDLLCGSGGLPVHRIVSSRLLGPTSGQTS